MSPRQGLVRGTLTYLRRDLREIIAPTSLPDDDEFAASVNGDDGRHRRRHHQRRNVLSAVASGIRDYRDSWKKSPEPSSVEAEQSTSNRARLEGDDVDDDVDADAAHRLETDAALREAASDARDALASASRAGAEALRPALRQLYRTRAAAYRDAVFSFVEGYREGLAGGGVGREKGDDDDEEDDDDGKEKTKNVTGKR